MKVINENEREEIIIDKNILRYLYIEDIEESAKGTSFEYVNLETFKAQLAKEEEELKLEYKIWLSDKKKEMDRKIYTNETAKEDGVIAKYREQYLQYNKKLIDLMYQRNLLQGISRATEMKANLLIALLTNKKSKEENDKKVAEWNKKVENTKI